MKRQKNHGFLGKALLFILLFAFSNLSSYGQNFQIGENGININGTITNWVVARGSTAPGGWTRPSNNPSYNTINGFVPPIATNFLSYLNGGNCYNPNGIWYPITNNPPNGWSPSDSALVFFRLAFNLPNGAIVSCKLHFFVDDSLALYINGTFVAANYHTAADFDQTQIGSLFTCGENVIAILGKNTQTPCYMLNFSTYNDSYLNIDTTQPINLVFTLPAHSIYCSSGDSVALQVPVQADHYSWSTGDSTAGIIVRHAGTYTVTISDGSTCSASGSATVAQDSVQLTSSQINAGCGAGGGSATVQVYSGIAPFQYLWNNAATTNAITNLAAGTYTVTTTDALGCSSSALITITGSGSATVSVTGPPNILCSGDSATICATAGFQVYNWNNGDTGQCIHALSAGNYYVTATENDNCSAVSNHFAVSFYPRPPVSINVNGDTMHVYDAVTQQWYLNGSPIPGATANVFIATTPGYYQVEVTDSNNCPTLSNPVQLLLGIGIITDDKVQVYPNPLSDGNWQLIVDHKLLGSLLEIFDASGKCVFKSQITNLHSEINFNAAKGIYLLRISSAGNSLVRKLVKL